MMKRLLLVCLTLALVLAGTACGEKEAPAPAPSSRLIGGGEEAPPEAEEAGTVLLQLPVRKDDAQWTVSLRCPADWENGGGSIDLAGKKLVEISWYAVEEEPAPYLDRWYQNIQNGEEKTVGGRTFRAIAEEYLLLDQEEKKQYPFIIYSYYTEEGGGYLCVTFFQNQETMPVSLETFERVLSTVSVKEGGPED